MFYILLVDAKYGSNMFWRYIFPFVSGATKSTMPTTVAAAASSSVGKLKPEETALFICDVQERFRPLISGFSAVVDTSRRMVRFEIVLLHALFICSRRPLSMSSKYTLAKLLFKQINIFNIV